MSTKMIAAAAALLVSTSAMAQAGPVAQKTSEQLLCELSGECGQETVEATQDKPDTRGFNINKRSAASAPQAAANVQAAPARARVVAPAARAAPAVAIAAPPTAAAPIAAPAPKPCPSA